MLWKYVIILVLFVPCCLMCDSTKVNVIYNYKKNRTPKFRRTDLTEGGLNFFNSYDNDNNSIGVGIKGINGTSKGAFYGFGYEINPLSISWINKDLYNNNLTSYSLISFAGPGLLGLSYLSKQIGIYDSTDIYSEIIEKAGGIFIILNNPQINVTILNLDLGKNHFITASALINYKFDYYFNNPVKWTRSKLSFGCEFDYLTTDSPFGLGFALGYSKSYDSGRDSKQMVPFIGIKLLYGRTITN